MRKLFILMILLIPMLLSAMPGIFHRSLLKTDLDLPGDLTRAFRLTQRMTAYFANEMWNDAERTVYYYNSDIPSQIDSLKTYAYDTEVMEWTEQMTVRITYVPGGTYVNSMEMGFSYMGMFYPMFQTLAFYDDQHRLTHFNYYSQPFGQKEWMPMQRMHIVYTSDTDYYVCSWQLPEEPGLPAYRKTTFEWDAQGRIILETEKSSIDSLSWQDENRTERIWHPHDTTTGSYFIEYISKYLPMMMAIDDDFVFPGMESQLIGYYWDQAWIPDSRDTYTYGADDKRLSLLYEYMSLGEWQNSELMEYTYDVNGNLAQKVTSYWDQGVRTWYLDQRDTNTWESFTSVSDPITPAIMPLNIKAYPVPFTSEISIIAATDSKSPVELRIYNARGQLVHRATTSPNTVYNWKSDLPGGMYIIKAESEGSATLKRVISIK